MVVLTRAAVAVFASLLSGCIHIEQHDNEVSVEEQACSTDAECVIVDLSCHCAEEGIAVAVNTKNADAVAARAGAICNNVESSDSSCTATHAVCFLERCALSG